jgi:hypothetical protein
MSDYPYTREGLVNAHFALLQRRAVCKGCDGPIEWWETPKRRKIPMSVKLVDGPRDEMTLHLEVCPNRQEFLGAQSGPGTRPPRKYTNEEAVRAMRDRTNARVVVLIDENGTVASWRKDIPAEDLRHDLISAANFVRTAANEEEAKR